MNFSQFLILGLEHIADINAYDHILFIVMMCVVYKPEEWKKILVLVTAFTLGHSLTLGLAALDWIKIDKNFIEFLIPLTIFLTAIWNVIPKKEKTDAPKTWFSWNYIIVLLFGLIHGLGFSNYFGMLMGRNANITIPLLGFNVGVEIGQIIIVIIFMLIAFIVIHLLKVKMKYWVYAISIVGMIMSIYLMFQSDFITDLWSK